MVSVPSTSVVDSGFDPQSGQAKNYKIGICRFSTKYAALRRKNKDWLVWNQNNVSEWSNMSTRGLSRYLFILDELIDSSDETDWNLKK
jgi:hypothetical protein